MGGTVLHAFHREWCGQILSCRQVHLAAVGENQNWRWAAEWGPGDANGTLNQG